MLQIDLLEHVAEDLPVNIEAYTNIDDLQSLLHDDGDSTAFSKRFARLTSGLCEVVEDFGLLSLAPLAIQDKDTIARVLELVDGANGYSMSGLQGRNPYTVASDAASTALTHVSSTPIWTGASTGL